MVWTKDEKTEDELAIRINYFQHVFNFRIKPCNVYGYNSLRFLDFFLMKLESFLSLNVFIKKF